MSRCFFPAEILLPRPEEGLETWGSIACDQFTSDRSYWERAEAVVGEHPSTLRLILPEVYLEDADVNERLAAIHKTMRSYLDAVLTRRVSGFIYVERTQTDGTVRQGLVGRVDLEQYDYRAGASTQIRPTEGTVVERIAKRLAVREGAELESPHVMMLMDDPGCTVLEPLAKTKEELPLVYSGELMLGGGRIEGRAVEDPAQCERLAAAVEALGAPEAFRQKYPQAAGQPPLTLASGDGNHSLATAKAWWEQVKRGLSPAEQETHPARFALVEVCNVHSPAIQIEPIHRLLLGCSLPEVETALAAWCRQEGIGFEEGPGGQELRLAGDAGEERVWHFARPRAPLCVGTVEAFLEAWLPTRPEAKVDYIHGADTARELARGQHGVALLLPDFEKSDLFRGVVLGGVLPRKTFSMGHAKEKRYYLECRRITNKV